MCSYIYLFLILWSVNLSPPSHIAGQYHHPKAKCCINYQHRLFGVRGDLSQGVEGENLQVNLRGVHVCRI